MIPVHFLDFYFFKNKVNVPAFISTLEKVIIVFQFADRNILCS
jgi:hypothetical protein